MKQAHLLVYCLISLAIIGCKDKPDECQQFFDKVVKYARGSGMGVSDAEHKTALEGCRRNPKEFLSDPTKKCILAAKDNAAIEACDPRPSNAKGPVAVEAELYLKQLGKAARTSYVFESTFPIGKAGPTPAIPCCEQPDKHCAVSKWSDDPVWRALDFAIEDTTLFQYTYESDGKTATATAVGDLDCDGTTITYTLRATSVDGSPHVEVTPPANGD